MRAFRERISVGFFLTLAVATTVAFVHHASVGNRRPSPYLLHAGDELKGLLDSSSYDNDVVKAYAGKTVKAAKKVKAGAYDLSVDSSSLSDATPPVEDIASSAPIVDTPPPPSAVDTPPTSETIEAMTKSVKKSMDSFTSTPPDINNPLEGLSVPTDVQENMQKPFSAMNSLLKDTQSSIEQTKAAAAARTAERAAATAAKASNPPGKVPTLGEYFTKALPEQRAIKMSDKPLADIKSVDIKLPDVDVKLPEMKLPENVKLPDVKLPPVQMDKVAKLSGEVTLPEAGKALPFNEYLRAKMAGALPSDADTSMMANIKAKFGIMAANYYKLIGEDAPDSLKFDNIKIDLSSLSSQLGTFDYQKMMTEMPEGAPWAAVAFGTFFVVAGARNKRPASMVEPKTMEAATAALGDLTEDLEYFQKRMKVLEETGLGLQEELKEAKEKLLEKELEISKEKLKVADNQLKSNREIERLEKKLKDNTAEVKKTLDESQAVKKQLEKTAKVVEELPSAEDEPVPAPAPAPKKAAAKNAAPKKKAVSKKKAAPKASAPAPAPEPAPEPAPAPAPKKAAPKATTAKKAAPKKAATKKKAASKKKGSAAVKAEPPAVFFADEAPAPAPAPKKKAAAKKKAAPKAKAAAKDMSSLSKSTLTRKTVKELTEFLDSKGVSTNGSDGKPLKKADLVEAVLSL